ncbi:MAG: hypothetical protein ACT4QF_01230 [Sporichthyaceae bacterium]
MGNPDVAWSAADAWAFAVVGSDGRCTLAELVSVANRAFPFVLVGSELETVLSKLVGSGLLRIYEDWTLEITDEAAALIEDLARATAEYGGAVAERLKCVDPTFAKVKLPQGVLDRALAEDSA